MKKEYISRALADTYYQAAYEGRDMRRVADQLENLRASIQEKDLYQAWRDVDKAVGQVLIQENEELFGILNAFRQSFVAWAYESAMAQIREGFGQSPEKGWKTFIKVFVEALVHWRYQIYTEIPKELDLEKIPEEQLALFLRISEKTPFMLEARWDQTYDLFVELAGLDFLEPSHRIDLHCSAAQIQLYFFSDTPKARALLEQAQAIGKDKEFSRVEQSFGELLLLDWQFDEARNRFQKASMLDPNNEFALLYMGDSYREEGRYSIAEAWYGDAQTLFPGGTDVLSRYIRLYEKRDYFKDHDPKKIRKLVDLTARLLPLEKYTALLDGGFAFQSNDQYDEAEKWYREAIDLDPQRGNAWVNLGYILEKKGNYGESEKAFQNTLQKEPDYFDAHWGLAFLYEQMDQKKEQAIQTLDTCRRLRPDWEVFIAPRIADLTRKLGKEEEANAILLSCLEKFPDKDAEPLRLLHDQVNDLPEADALALLDRIRDIKGDGYADNFLNRAGNVKFQFQKYEEAADYYRQAIAIDPKVPIYHYNLGLAMDRLDKLDEAETAYQEYLSLETPTADNLNTIGVFYYKKRQAFERAAALYKRAIEGNPQNDNFYYNLALVQEKLEQWSDAEASYLKAIECDPEDPENFNGLGVFYYNRQLYEQAIENYLKAISINPEESLYFANLGLVHQQMGHADQELEAYQKAAFLNPRYHLEVGRVLYGRGQNEEAIQAFERAGELVDQFPVNLAYWGLACENLGQIREAESFFRKALGLDPALDDYFYNRLGILCYRQNRHQEAITLYREAINLAPLAVYYENLGLVYEATGEEAQVVAAYEKAMELEPDNGQFPNRMGVYLFSKSRNAEAIGFYEKALALDPENAVFQNNLALALEATAHFEEAEQAYKKAIELDPKTATYPNFLGGMYFRAQRFEEAAACFEQTIALDSSIAFYFENLGLAREMLGQIAEAEEAFRKAIETEPQSPVYQNRLGLFFFNQGRNADAIPFYQKALDKEPDNVIYLANMGLAHLNLGDKDKAAGYFEKALLYQPNDPQLESYLEMARKGQG